MGAQAVFAVELELMTCGGCGTVFGVHDPTYRRYQDRGESVRCTNPKCPWPSMVPGETDAARLKKQLEAERARADRAAEGRRWAERQAEREKRRHAATKGQLTKTKKRLSGGVCPCCKRTFENLMRHMKTKHPKYAEATDA